MRHVVRIAVAATTLVVAGCASFRPVPPLDDQGRSELAALAPLMARERVRVVAANTDAVDETGDYSAAIRLAGATLDERAPSLTIEVQPSSHSLEEPMFLVLTLGLLPHRSRGWRRYEWRLVAADGRQIVGDTSMTSPDWVGWLVGPIALLPGWKLSATWAKESQERERHSDARRERLALELARSIVRLRDAE